MEITFSQKQGRVSVTIAQVNGKVDSATYQEFTAAVLNAMAKGAKYLLLDLSACEYMSSAGIRSLNELYLKFRQSYPGEAANKRSSHLKLLNPSEKLMSIFSISGVDAFFEVHTNLESAVASF